MTRRDAIKSAAVLAGATATISARADGPPRTVRMAEPPNYEYPFDTTEVITPTERFYVRNHFPTPTVDAAAYTLEVTGAVETPLKLSLADILALPQETQPLTLECAGNGRVFLSPATRGLQWQLGAVGNATWTGVLLKTILEKAKVQASAVEVILVGADRGAITGDPPSPGPIPFDRSIPIAKALAPESMLAHTMNGAPLTPDHGFPLRAVVGGWYGMAAVKWLTRIVVTDKPYQGFWQTFDYSVYERRDGGLPTIVPITAMLPKAQIAAPAAGESFTKNTAITLRGAAWGERPIAKVEVSDDGGKTWSAAKLVGEAKPYCWRLWEFPWTTPAARGPVKLLARATDDRGLSQPEKRDPDRRTYVVNHLVPVEVMVK